MHTDKTMKRFLSQNQRLLLNLFYTHPKRAFYMQELGRIVGKKPGVFQRTLNALAEEGLLKSEYRANARFFQANTQHPLYRELKSIIAKTTGVQVALQDLLQDLKGIRMALLYGSFAKGTDRPDSDIDLLVVGKPNSEELLIKGLAQIEKAVLREINYKFYNEHEYRLKRLKKDPFLTEILTDKKILLKGDLDAV
jgi:predicted nucleotidyltransferase